MNALSLTKVFQWNFYQWQKVQKMGDNERFLKNSTPHNLFLKKDSMARIFISNQQLIIYIYIIDMNVNVKAQWKNNVPFEIKTKVNSPKFIWNVRVTVLLFTASFWVAKIHQLG